MAKGNKHFGTPVDPNFSSSLANFTDDTRRGSGGGNSTSWTNLSDTKFMPSGMYRCRLDFQVYNTTADMYIRMDGGTKIPYISHIWRTGLLVGQLSSKEIILRVDKAIGSYVTIQYPHAFYGLSATFEYLGPL